MWALYYRGIDSSEQSTLRTQQSCVSQHSPAMEAVDLARLWRGEMFRRIKLPNYPLFVAADFKKPWHCPLIAINLVLPGKRRQYCISGGCGARRSITPVRTCRHVNIYLDASRGAKEISIYFLAGVQEGAQPQLAEITTLPLHF